MARKIWQCENCKGYMDYDGQIIELQNGRYGMERWCDDCGAKVKQRATVENPQPIVGDEA